MYEKMHSYGKMFLNPFLYKETREKQTDLRKIKQTYGRTGDEETNTRKNPAAGRTRKIAQGKLILLASARHRLLSTWYAAKGSNSVRSQLLQ